MSHRAAAASVVLAVLGLCAPGAGSAESDSQELTHSLAPECECVLALCLSLSGDRTRPFHTKLPINQGYLNQIAAPPEVAVLTPMFEELAQAEREGNLPGLRLAVRTSL